jgi:signal peptidase II
VNRTRALILAASIFIVDQLMKWIVLNPVGLAYEGDSRELLPFFDLTLVFNEGVSLGLLSADEAWQRWALVALTGGIAAFVLRWLWKEENRHDAIGLGMIFGGAIGNLLDRIRFGHVVDYADLHFGTFRPFLVFNVADAAITIGVLILLARALFVRDKPANPKLSESDNA